MRFRGPFDGLKENKKAFVHNVIYMHLHNQRFKAHKVAKAENTVTIKGQVFT